MNSQKDIKVGFILHPDHWLGGRNYLKNLFSALRTLPDKDITPILFTGLRTSDPSVGLSDVQLVRAPLFDPNSLAWFARSAYIRATSQDRLLRKLLTKHGVAILSHSGHLGIQSATARGFLPTIGWVPDFQHVHLPEFFSSKDLQYRDREYMNICLQCDGVIVSSECARSDLETFAPDCGRKATVLRFVASPAPLQSTSSVPELQRLYGFDGPYFLLPNQFWAHKNHRVVIDALKKLKQQGTRITVLATGVTDDTRDPNFFASLMEYVKECNVLDAFRVLGSIPFDHLASLMQHTIAFVNPSRFEGWSTSVEEAKSMGKQILLSDIPVHREQAPPRGIFFPLADPDALANALLDAQNVFDPQHDAEMQELARKQFPARQEAFGEAYKRIVVDALSLWQ